MNYDIFTLNIQDIISWFSHQVLPIHQPLMTTYQYYFFESDENVFESELQLLFGIIVRILIKLTNGYIFSRSGPIT